MRTIINDRKIVTTSQILIFKWRLLCHSCRCCLKSRMATVFHVSLCKESQSFNCQFVLIVGLFCLLITLHFHGKWIKKSTYLAQVYTFCSARVIYWCPFPLRRALACSACNYATIGISRVQRLTEWLHMSCVHILISRLRIRSDKLY